MKRRQDLGRLVAAARNDLAFREYVDRCEKILREMFHEDESAIESFRKWANAVRSKQDQLDLLLHEEPLYTVAEFIQADPRKREFRKVEREYNVFARDKGWEPQDSEAKRRVSEPELRIAALQLLSKAPRGFLTTSDLIIGLSAMFKPEGIDAAILSGRSDTYFSQKVRNMVSHRGSSTSLMKRGFVVYDKDRQAIEITKAGRAFLESKGLA